MTVETVECGFVLIVASYEVQMQLGYIFSNYHHHRSNFSKLRVLVLEFIFITNSAISNI